MNRFQKTLAKLFIPNTPFLFQRRQRNKTQIDTTVATSVLGETRADRLYAFTPGLESEVLKMLKNCSVSPDTVPPHEWTKLSRILYDHFTLVKNAVDLHARMVGGLHIPQHADISDEMRKRIEQILDNTPILSEMQPYHSNQKGLNKILQEMLIEALIDGMAFAQDRFEETEGGDLTDNHIGVMLFDSDNFSFQYTPENFYVLSYLDMQYPQLDENEKPFDNPFFHVLKLRSHRKFMWGVPLLRGCSVSIKVLTSMIAAVEVQTKRFANPASYHIISDDSDQNSQNISIIREALKNFKAGLIQAVKKMASGIASNLVYVLPGKVKVETRTLGSDFQNFIDHEMLWKQTIYFLNGMGIPPMLYGIRVGNVGIGSDEFKYQFALFLSKVTEMRDCLKHVAFQMLKNILLADGFSEGEVENLPVEFNQMEFLSEEEKAQIMKLKAESIEKLYSVYAQIRITNPDAAEQFAEEHGLYKIEDMDMQDPENAANPQTRA